MVVHGARPVKADAGLDCALRRLAIDYAAKILPTHRGADALMRVADALQYEQLCNGSTSQEVQLAMERAPPRTWVPKIVPGDYDAYVCPTTGHDGEQALGIVGLPFRTLERALASVRAARLENQSDCGSMVATRCTQTTIWLRKGIHRLHATVVLTPADSNLTFHGYPNESAVLSGGWQISPQWDPEAHIEHASP